MRAFWGSAAMSILLCSAPRADAAPPSVPQLVIVAARELLPGTVIAEGDLYATRPPPELWVGKLTYRPSTVVRAIVAAALADADAPAPSRRERLPSVERATPAPAQGHEHRHAHAGAK